MTRLGTAAWAPWLAAQWQRQQQNPAMLPIEPADQSGDGYDHPGLPGLPRLPSLGFGQQQPQVPQDITPEEESNWLGNILAPVAAVGNFLSVPSDMLINALGGENPLAPLASPLTDEGRLGGRGLLRKAGLVGEEDNWGNFLAGLGTQILLDPLNAIAGVGVVSKLGKLANVVKEAPAAVAGVAKGAKVLETIGQAAKAGNVVNAAEKSSVIAKMLEDAKGLSSLIEEPGKAAGIASGVEKARLAFEAGNLDDAARLAQEATWTAAPAEAQKVFTTSGSLPEFMRTVPQTLTGELPPAAIGKTPVALAQQYRTGQRALLKLKLPIPFTNIGELDLGVGGVAGNLVANIIEKAAYSPGLPGLPLRTIRALFSSSAGRGGVNLSAQVQRARDVMTIRKDAHLAGIANMRGARLARHAELADEWAAMGVQYGVKGDNEAFRKFIQYASQERKGMSDLDDIVTTAEAMRASGAPPEMIGKAATFVDKTNEYLKSILMQENDVFGDVMAYGGRGEWLDDTYLAYAPRRGLWGKGETVTELGRKKELTNIPLNTIELNEASQDMLISSLMSAGKTERGLARRSMLDWMIANKNMPEAWKQGSKAPKGPIEIARQYVYQRYVLPKLIERFEDGAKTITKNDGTIITLADEIKRWTEVTPHPTTGKDVKPAIERFTRFFTHRPLDKRGLPIFDNELDADHFSYMNGAVSKLASLMGIHDMLKQPEALLKMGTEPGLIPIGTAWNRAGLNQRGLDKLGASMGLKKDAWQSMGVTESTAKAIKAMTETVKPKELNAIWKTYDRIQSVFRGWYTLPRPAFHGRNQITGAFQEAIEGHSTIAEGLVGKWDAARYLKSGGKAGLSADEVTELMSGTVLKGAHMTAQIGEQGGELAMRTPETLASGAWQATKELFTTNPLKNLLPRGVRVHPSDVAKGAVEEIGPLWKLGESAYSAVEFINRAGYYVTLRRKGFSVAQAEHLVKKVHFDYSEMSWFEKNVARRGPLFWSWMRKNIPYTLEKIASNPSGKTAWTMRTMAMAQRDDDKSALAYTPGFIKERSGIPVSRGDKNATYLTSMGLPVEDLNNILAVTGKFPFIRPQRTVEKMLAQVNPLLQTPMELISGKQMWSGRPVGALTSRSEKYLGEPNRLLDFALARGPWSNVVSGIETVADTREGKTVAEKALNLTTGLKFTTQEPEKWKRIDMAERMKQELQATPTVREGTYQYVPEKYKPYAGPEVVSQLQRLRELQKLLELQRLSTVTQGP